MKTQLIKISDAELDEKNVALAARLLTEGQLVAIPTETVYGLAGNALDGTTVRRIYEAKGRPQDNPMIVHISDISQLDGVCTDIPGKARALALKFWPGPLTMVLNKAESIPYAVTAGLPTVAVRCPSHPVARAIIRAAGIPLAAPSANLSGKPSPTEAAHVLNDLYGRIDAVVDGGACTVGLESTVIDLTCTPPRLLRPGGITLEQLEAVLGEVAVDGAVSGNPGPDVAPRAPGMKYRHYAPEAQVLIVRGRADDAAKYIRANADQKTAVLCYDEELPLFDGLSCVAYGALSHPDTLARGLFSALRKLDGMGLERIFARCPEGGGLLRAVENRLKKAAGFQIIDV